MPSFLGTKDISQIYWGNKAVSVIYLGQLEVYNADTQEDDSMFLLANGDFLYTSNGKIFDTAIERVGLPNGDDIATSSGEILYVHD